MKAVYCENAFRCLRDLSKHPICRTLSDVERTGCKSPARKLKLSEFRSYRIGKRHQR